MAAGALDAEYHIVPELGNVQGQGQEELANWPGSGVAAESPAGAASSALSAAVGRGGPAGDDPTYAVKDRGVFKKGKNKYKERGKKDGQDDKKTYSTPPASRPELLQDQAHQQAVAYALQGLGVAKRLSATYTRMRILAA